MKTDWISRSLSELGTVVRDQADIQSGKKYELWSVPSFAENEPELVSGQQVGSAKLLVRANDVLLCKINPRINRVWLVREPRAGLTQMASPEWIVFRCQPDVMPEWLAHYFSSPEFRELITGEVSGATGSHTRAKPDRILNHRIGLPPLEEQRRIVAILDEVLEAIATATANAEKNLANAKDLFDKYLQAMTGPTSALGDVVNITTGKLDANAAKEGGLYPFFTCSREIFAIDKFAFDCEAILLAGNNAVGDFNVKHYQGKFNAYQRTYVITSKDKKVALPRYIFFQLQRALKVFKEASVGSGTKFLKIGMIRDLPVILPSLEDQISVAGTLDSLYDIAKSLEELYERKLSLVSELRQTTFQKALSGELTSLPSNALDAAAE